MTETIAFSSPIIAAMGSASPLDSLSPVNREGPYLRLLCVNIFVRDQEKSLRFFVDRLGFGVVVDENYESGGRWLAVAPPHLANTPSL